MNGGDILFDALNGVSGPLCSGSGGFAPDRRGNAARARKGKALENGAACRGARAAARRCGLCGGAFALEGSRHIPLRERTALSLCRTDCAATKNIRRHRRMVDVGRGAAEDLDGTRLEFHAKGTTLCAKPARHTGRRHRRPRQSCGRSRRPTVLSFIPRASL